MSTSLIYNWLAPDASAICLIQTLASAGNLNINGTLSNIPTAFGNVVFLGISRNISIKSVNNLSGVNFTIDGIYNGKSISETISGPNNNTVYSTKIFDVITNVSTDAAAANVSVGTGLIGQTHWFEYDYNVGIAYYTVQVIVSGTITYSFNVTADDIKSVGSPSLVNPIKLLTNSTTTQFQSFPTFPFYYGNISVSSSTAGSSLTILISRTGNCN